MRDIVRDIYCDSSFRVAAGREFTSPIDLQRGVKQGCPLSPILFNFCLEGLLRGLHALQNECSYSLSEQLKVNSLAFADDLGVFADSRKATDTLVARVGEFLDWSGVSPNIAKCGSLATGYIAGKRKIETQPFLLRGEQVPVLGWDERYAYLGTPIGFDSRADLDKPGEKYRDRVRLICQSGLADWQRLVALKQFALPVLDFHLRNELAFETWGENLDRFTRRQVGKALGLPARTALPLFYTDQGAGGLGLTNVRESIHVMRVVQAVKMLVSRDRNIREVALQQLDEVIGKRTGVRDPSTAQRLAFLNGELKIDNESRHSNDIRSLWSTVRKSASKIGVRFVELEEQDEEDWFAVELDSWVEGGEPTHLTGKRLRGRLIETLRDHLSCRWLLRWKALKDQGKCVPAFSASPASNSWLRDCRNLRYREYRWCLKARVDLLPVGAVRNKWRGAAPAAPVATTCPACPAQDETLPHVLNNCKSRMVAIRERHNAILQRLHKALPRGNRAVLDQKLPDCPIDLRVDLQVIDPDKKVATLVDVGMPFENGSDAFSRVRQRKEEKYKCLADWLRQEKGFTDVFVGAFVIGSLGGYDPDNETVLNRLGVARNYTPLFRKLCVVDAIHGSYEVWRERCIGFNRRPE
eukprot:scpid47705/ scgid24297/ Retrovirus-related Pol polyprotein from type-2 retrotransposable element R2DM; Retrovirus-related Pol polyprotein from type II retrotransposable element R2DM; Protease; Reverse transcriptase; Endonuclease